MEMGEGEDVGGENEDGSEKRESRIGKGRERE